MAISYGVWVDSAPQWVWQISKSPGLIGLKEELVSNGYFLFAEEVTSKPQNAEEFIKSFQFSLKTKHSRFSVSQGKEGISARQKSSRISLINSLWHSSRKTNTSLPSEFIFYVTPATRSSSMRNTGKSCLFTFRKLVILRSVHVLVKSNIYWRNKTLI